MPRVRARATVFVAYAKIIVGLGALGPLQTAYRGESQTWWIWIYENFGEKSMYNRLDTLEHTRNGAIGLFFGILIAVI